MRISGISLRRLQNPTFVELYLSELRIFVRAHNFRGSILKSSTRCLIYWVVGSFTGLQARTDANIEFRDKFFICAEAVKPVARQCVMRDTQRSLPADNIASTLSETVVLLCCIVLSYTAAKALSSSCSIDVLL